MATDPSTADSEAKRDGLPLLDRIRTLRAAFGLSLAAAKAVTDATDGRPLVFPEVADAGQLKEALAAELGYCPRVRRSPRRAARPPAGRP